MVKSTSNSPKISVNGDYESYARRPRKKRKTKLQEASDTLPDTLPDKNNENPKSEANGINGMKRLGTSDSIELDMPIKNFPNPTDEKEKQIPILYDSLPKRKQAKVELMKQVRRELTEEKLGSQHSTRDVTRGPNEGKTVVNTRKDIPPVTSPRRNSHSPSKETREKPSFSREEPGNERFDPLLRVQDPILSSSKNLIRAMIVRSLLPPIKSSHMQSAYSVTHSNDYKYTTSGLEVTNKSSKQNYTSVNKKLDMTYHFQRGSRLRQGSTKYVYRPNSNNTLHSQQNKRSPYKLVRQDNNNIEASTILWRAKLTYRGKPTFQKRSPSPTLGEEAIARKITNRLPTRQIHPLPPHHTLYSEALDRHESWRRPPTNAYRKEPAQAAIDKTAKSNAYPAYDTAFWRRTILSRLPHPRIPLHKARALQQ